ncbi:MAG: cyclopropane fatty acyl phospholipid synthase [Nanoarchaeota archaeon]
MLLLRKSRNKDILSEIFSHARIKINGDNPWDINVHNQRFYDRVISNGSLGLGESYMDGDWDCNSLDQLFDKITTYNLRAHAKENYPLLNLLIRKILSNINSDKLMDLHYDLGNDLYIEMLGGNPMETENHAFMQYTCSYKGNEENNKKFNLRNSQINKLELICKKADLRRGMKLLELGSGFGGFANYASRNYGVEVTCYNISKQQIEFSREWNNNLPIKIINKDYRLAEGKFDRIISIGLAEHVNLKELMEIAHSCLSENGLFILHNIGKIKSENFTNPWITKYIFPGGNLPSISQLSKATEGLFTILDLHNFGQDYDPTLMAWNENFQSSWPRLEKKYNQKVKGKFKRMWEYYLLSCAGAFRVSEENPKAVKNQLFQLVLSKAPLKKYIFVR